MSRWMPFAASMMAALAFAVAGCDKKPETAPVKPAPKADTHAHDGDKHDHDHAHGDGHAHGDETELGSVTIAGFTVKVTQDGKVEEGKEAAFDLAVSGGTGKPAAARAWIGTEDAKGSMKAKAEKEEAGFHAHVEAPKPMPAGSKLWIELEDEKGVKSVGSVNLK